MTNDNKNSLWSAIQHSTTLFLSLIGLKINLITFNSDIYGIWVLLLSIWGFGSVLDLGFGLSIIRFIAISKEDIQKKSRTISTCLFMYQIAGVIIIILCSILAMLLYFSNSKIFPKNSLDLCKTVFFILGVNFYFQYISTVFRSAIEGANNYVLSSKILILLSLINFVFTVITFVFKLHLQYLAIFTLITGITQFTVFYLMTRIRYPELQIRLFSLDISVFKEILKFSTSVQITYLLGALMDPIIKYIIGFYSSSSTITTYEIARKFSIAISNLYAITFRNALPMSSILKSKQDYQNFLYSKGVSITKLGIFYAGFFYGIVSLVFAAMFKYFYHNEDSLHFFFILSLAETVNTSGYLIYVFLLGLGKAILLSILQGLNVILTTVFLILGFALFNSNLGLIGYFISVILGNIFMFFLIRKFTEIKLSLFFKNSRYWKLISILLLFILNVIFVNLFPDHYFFFQILVSIFCLIIFSEDIFTAIIELKKRTNFLHFFPL